MMRDWQEEKMLQSNFCDCEYEMTITFYLDSTIFYYIILKTNKMMKIKIVLHNIYFSQADSSYRTFY